MGRQLRISLPWRLPQSHPKTRSTSSADSESALRWPHPPTGQVPHTCICRAASCGCLLQQLLQGRLADHRPQR